MHPFVAVIRRYVDDYTNGHDLTVVPEIMDRGYRFTMSGTTIDYDRYVAMVDGAFDHFPDLRLVVHDLFTDGERLAMHFSEHGSSAGHGGRRAVWSGISMYRWDGTGRLLECKVEQDFYGRRVQIGDDTPAALPAAMPDPWGIEPLAGGAGVVGLAREWASAGTTVECLEPDRIEIDDVFASGSKAAVRWRAHGSYRGGLHGVPEASIGSPAWIDAMAVLDVTGERAEPVATVWDRFGLQRRLRH